MERHLGWSTSQQYEKLPNMGTSRPLVKSKWFILGTQLS